jgi:hypothetical protein
MDQHNILCKEVLYFIFYNKKRLPKLLLNTNHQEKEVEVVLKRDGKTSSWRRVEECMINNPS